jgi:hypothetical protein
MIERHVSKDGSISFTGSAAEILAFIVGTQDGLSRRPVTAKASDTGVLYSWDGTSWQGPPNASSSPAIGDGTGEASYQGGSVVTGTATKAVAFTITALVSRYYLTADGLAIALDNALPVGHTVEFWHRTGTQRRRTR